MSADALLRDWIAPSRRRRFADTLLLALPLLFAIAAISWRLAGLLTTGVLLLGGAALALVVARQRAARHDRVWLIRTLDAARPELEDSSALLFSPIPPASPLQALQRTRIAARLDQGTPQDLGPPWSRRPVIALLLAAMLIVAAALL